MLFKLQFTWYEDLSVPGLVDLWLVNYAGDPVMIDIQLTLNLVYDKESML